MEYVASEEWLEPEFLLHSQDEIEVFLSKANECLVENSKRMLLDQKFRIIKKERAVGVFFVYKSKVTKKRNDSIGYDLGRSQKGSVG